MQYYSKQILVYCFIVSEHSIFFNNIISDNTVSGSSQCYWDELRLLKCEPMLLKCQISTNTIKKEFLLSTECLERFMKFSYLVSIISIFFIYVCQFYNHFVLICHLNSISKHFNSISSPLALRRCTDWNVIIWWLL